MKYKKNDIILIVAGIAFMLILIIGLALVVKTRSEREKEKSPQANIEVEEVDIEKIKELARIEGIGEGKAQILNQLKETAIDSNSVMQAFREVFKEEVIVYSKGELKFIPINPNIKKSEIEAGNVRVNEKGEYEYEEAGTVISKKGIDVSKYQGDIDWEKVVADGVSYAFIRAGIRGYGTGTIVPDPTFAQNIRGATEMGIKVGPYFYSQAISEKEAIEEAEFVLNSIKGFNISYPIVIDIEMVGDASARGDQLSMEERTKIVVAFCEKIKSAGFIPMIYGNSETFTQMLDIEQIKDYERWFAFYGDSINFPYEFSVWQYTHEGNVDGIQGPTDLNIAFKEW